MTTTTATTMHPLKIGSHVGMNGKEMFYGSVKEALSYQANTFMVYTGAPQNTRRKELSQLRIPEAHALPLPWAVISLSCIPAPM